MSTLAVRTNPHSTNTSPTSFEPPHQDYTVSPPRSSMDRPPKEPFQASQWLLEAARKRTGPSTPSKSLRDAIQHARDHPSDVARKLREDALESGRDPSALANWMAEMSRKTPERRLAQRSKQHPAQAASDQQGTAGDGEEPTEDGEIVESDGVPSPGPVAAPTSPALRARPASSVSQTAAPRTKTLVPASATAQSRVGAKGQILKPTQAKKQNSQVGSKKSVGRQKPTKAGGLRSSSSAASPMDIDTLQPTAESSASGARPGLNSADSVSAVSPPNAQPHPFPARLCLPSWYLTVSKQSMDLLERKRPQELTAIDALKACIDRCEKEEKEQSEAKLAKEYNDLRDHVHKAESSLNMDKVKIKKTRILTSAGLPRIFDENGKFPWDLKADAWHLYEKWMNEDFSRDILRGIVTVKGKDRNGDRLDPAYRTKHPKDPKQFGDNGAVLGQWWPSQLCAVRDGIHGAAQGGIYGDKEQGAYSIVLSSGGYHDKDFGDVIEYSGTEGNDFKIKAATQSMITSAKLGNHIRVLRSAQLPKSNKYRPDVGLRYDGLYQIKSYEEMNVEKQDYLFHLERVPGQQPIRFEGHAKRPTIFEIQEYERCKGRL